MMHTIEDARRLIRENKIVDAKNILKKILDKNDSSIESKKESLIEIIKIYEILGIELQVIEMKSQLLCIYFELKNYRSAINCYLDKKENYELSGQELKALTYSFAFEGEIYNFKMMLSRYVEYLLKNKFFQYTDELSTFLKGRLRPEEIDEILFDFYILSGDDRNIEEILNKISAKKIINSENFDKSFERLKSFYSKKIAPYSYYQLYISYLMDKVKTSEGKLSYVDCKNFIKSIFDAHVFYPQKIELLKYIVEYSCLIRSRKIGVAAMDVVKRNFRTLRRTDLLFFKKLAETIILLGEDEEIIPQRPLSLIKRKDKIETLVPNGVTGDERGDLGKIIDEFKRPDIIIPLSTISEYIDLNSYADIFIIFNELGLYREASEVLNYVKNLLKNEDQEKKEILLRHKINIEYLEIENLFCQGKYESGLRAADTVLISFPLKSEERITFWYLIAEAHFHLEDYRSALKYYGMVNEQNRAYRITRLRIGQIEQDK